MTARQIAKSILPRILVNAARRLLLRPNLSGIGPSQSNEADLIDQLLRRRDIRPTFSTYFLGTIQAAPVAGLA